MTTTPALAPLTTLADLPVGTFVTYEVPATEICHPSTDALLGYANDGGTFGGIVTGTRLLHYSWGRPCFGCDSHWHPEVTDRNGYLSGDFCAAELTVVTPEAVLAADDTHGDPAHTGTPATCWPCRDAAPVAPVDLDDIPF